MSIRREWLERDYYAVLGVDRTASAKDIKKAFRALAQEHHPDTNPGDAAAEAKFKDISEAYDVLSDDATRREYDQARDAFARGAYAGAPGGGTQYVRIEDLGDLGDLFGSGGMFGGLGDLFGGGRRSRSPQQGGDLETQVSLSFHEAVEGTTRTLTVDGPSGRREVQVKIPAGINDGARIRLRGQGRPGANGGAAGDLFVRVHAASHPIFSRSGKDLKLKAPITVAEAALGATITVPTLSGTVSLKVPPGTQTGTVLRARGKGVETPQGTGDLLVTVEVRVPERATGEQRELLERLRELDDNPRSHLGV